MRKSFINPAQKSAGTPQKKDGTSVSNPLCRLFYYDRKTGACISAVIPPGIRIKSALLGRA